MNFRLPFKYMYDKSFLWKQQILAQRYWHKFFWFESLYGPFFCKRLILRSQIYTLCCEVRCTCFLVVQLCPLIVLCVHEDIDNFVTDRNLQNQHTEEEVNITDDMCLHRYGVGYSFLTHGDLVVRSRPNKFFISFHLF